MQYYKCATTRTLQKQIERGETIGSEVNIAAKPQQAL